MSQENDSQTGHELVKHPSKELVLSADRQLCIAAYINKDIERERIIGFLSRHLDVVLNMFSEQAPLDAEALERFQDDLDWRKLSKNKNLSFNESLIQRFKDRWLWISLLRNTAVIWNDELVRQYNSKIEWNIFCHNQFDFWTRERIEKHKDYIHWDVFSLTQNTSIWDEEFINQYQGRLDWNRLSNNPTLPWSRDFIAKHEHRLNWEKLGCNTSLPWTLDFINEYESRWAFGDSPFCPSRNEGWPWSLELIDRYFDRWNWANLSSNRGLPWSEALIDRYINSWKFHCLSTNTALPWSKPLLDKYDERWYWNPDFKDPTKGSYTGSISGNKKLPWNIDFIQQYQDRFDWRELSRNPGLPWNSELLISFEHHWDYACLEIPRSMWALLSQVDLIMLLEAAIHPAQLHANSSIAQQQKDDNPAVNADLSVAAVPIHLSQSSRSSVTVSGHDPEWTAEDEANAVEHRLKKPPVSEKEALSELSRDELIKMFIEDEPFCGEELLMQWIRIVSPNFNSTTIDYETFPLEQLKHELFKRGLLQRKNEDSANMTHLYYVVGGEKGKAYSTPLSQPLTIAPDMLQRQVSIRDLPRIDVDSIPDQYLKRDGMAAHAFISRWTNASADVLYCKTDWNLLDFSIFQVSREHKKEKSAKFSLVNGPTQRQINTLTMKKTGIFYISCYKIQNSLALLTC